ncbi:unnamed protein product [Fraxinus pennsylvanica]|uniref:Uncharacterized protein n=1 Tax=Fraxinus pennsylvanica TaxID=56036 RepID=A0AAD2DKT1_9LAMI|nr:unnamed protein product [Fraxinus pennsylvanica]
MESFSKNQEEQFERIENKLRFLSVTTKSWDQMLKGKDSEGHSIAAGVSKFSEKAHNDKQSNTEKPHMRTSFGALSENGQILTNGTKEIGELLEEFTRETDSESRSDAVEHVDNDDKESDEDNEGESEDNYEDGVEPASHKDDKVHVRAEMMLAEKTDVIHSVHKGGKSIGEREINALLLQHGDVFKVLPVRANTSCTTCSTQGW